MREFPGKAAGLSRAQVTRLIGRYRATGRVEDRRGADGGRPFARVCTPADIRLPVEADGIGGQLCGPAACEAMRREYEVFGDARFERLARLSPSHLHDLRRSKTCRARRTTVEHTRPTTVRIGERRRPDPRGRPGCLRVDTVHAWTSTTLGDRNGVKGVYDINLADPDRLRSAVTQFEHVGAVPGIAESFPVPLLERMLAALPFVVFGFHADNCRQSNFGDGPGGERQCSAVSHRGIDDLPAGWYTHRNTHRVVHICANEYRTGSRPCSGGPATRRDQDETGCRPPSARGVRCASETP